jgi:hypothetical protein
MNLPRFIILVAGLWPAAALTDEYSDMRTSCDPVVTALFDDCIVQNFYRCASGGTYAETLVTSEVRSAMLVGPDYELIYQRDVATGTGLEYVVDVNDAFSLTDLLRRGEERVSIVVRNSLVPGLEMDSELLTHVRLYDDHQPFSVGNFSIAAFHQNVLMPDHHRMIESQGIYLIDPLTRILVIAESATRFRDFASNDDFDWQRSANVIDIVGPDSPYFMSQTPEETCRLLLSSFVPSTAQKLENNHDNL